MTNKTGILLTNIGTPSEPTTREVRKYLREFLSDRRVVEIHPLLWQPILHGFILRTRPRKSAKLYQKIWTDQGSPLLVYSNQIAERLQTKLGKQVLVSLGMHYGEPSIPAALEKLFLHDCKKMIILPLFPQYSAASTASSFDRVVNELKLWRQLPDIHFINDYAEMSLYINALALSILHQGPLKYLLFSFHGIPEQYANQGDPYPKRCLQTATLVAEKLKLSKDQWSISFQSRLGRTQWLTPYTDVELSQLPSRGITDVSVICPGFAVDCLETLEEIAIRGKEQFLNAGGNSFNYIPALNDSDEQIEMLSHIVSILF